MPLSTGQQVALALTPKFSGTLSFLSSLWIFLDVVADKSKRNKLYHRILLGFSILDILVSPFAVASTWAIPRSDGVLWSAGNKVTCDMQAFFFQVGTGAFVYNASLTIYFVLVIRYGIVEAKLKRYEALFVGIPWLYGLGVATTSLVLDHYANAVLWCWISSQGDAAYFRWGTNYFPLWFCFLVVLAGMTMVFFTVRQRARQTAKLDGHRKFQDSTEGSKKSWFRRRKQQNKLDRRTQQVATQCLLYVLAFYATYFFATSNRVYQQLTGKSSFPLLWLHILLVPLQGFLNFLIYQRPQYLRIQRNNPEWGGFRIIREAMAANAILGRSNDQQGGGNKSGRTNRLYNKNRKQQRPNGNNTGTTSCGRRNISTTVTLQDTSSSYVADRSSLTSPAMNDAEKMDELDNTNAADSNMLQGQDHTFPGERDSDVEVGEYDDDEENDFDFDDMDALPTESFHIHKKNSDSADHSRGEKVGLEDEEEEEVVM